MKHTVHYSSLNLVIELRHNMRTNLLKWLNKDSWRLSASLRRNIAKIHRTQVTPKTWVRKAGLLQILGRTASAASLSSGQLRTKLRKWKEGLCSPCTRISLLAKRITSVVEQKKRGPYNTQIFWNFTAYLGIAFQPILCWILAKSFEFGKVCLSLIGNILIFFPRQFPPLLFCFFKLLLCECWTSYSDSLRFSLFIYLFSSLLFSLLFHLLKKFFNFLFWTFFNIHILKFQLSYNFLRALNVSF